MISKPLFNVSQQIKFAKVKPEAIIPSKRVEDAGFDIYACFEEDYMVIKPHETKLIPTGIASACDPSLYLQLYERGSTGTKGMGQRCGVIDSGYRGEWFVPITNHNNVPIIISKNDNLPMDFKDLAIVYPYTKAICQAVVHFVPLVEVEEISYADLKAIASERGVGALGSSNK